MEVKIPSSAQAPGVQEPSLKRLAVVDVPGHFHFRDQLVDSVEVAKAVVVLVDSKEKEKFGETAEIIYEIINKVALLDRPVPVVVACNKQDLQFAKKATAVESELEREIEELRKVKRATQQDEANAKIGYLEDLKKKFSFSDTHLPIQFIECSVKSEELTEVYKFINVNF